MEDQTPHHNADRHPFFKRDSNSRLSFGRLLFSSATLKYGGNSAPRVSVVLLCQFGRVSTGRPIP
jgi:hypothetical protein